MLDTQFPSIRSFFKSPTRQSRVSLFISTLSLIAILEPAAHAVQSWSSQPSWATSSEAPRRRVIRDDRPTATPFAPGSSNLSLDVGQVFLMGDLGTKYNDSIGTRLHYTYGVSDMFSFDSSFGFSNHSNSKMSMTTLLSGMRMNIAWFDKVVPYIVFGLGFYRPAYDVKSGSTTQAVSPILFGVHLGPGVNLILTKNIFFGASIQFHNMFSTSELLSNGDSVRVGGSFTSFFLNAGLSI